VLGRVVLADRFGNLITNIGATVPGGLSASPWSRPAVARWPLLPTYGARRPGAALALVNAFGLLELAVNGGNAAAAARPG
jgi:S-adenosyl-L-methionine hydrolase (adenosine-forming)